MLVKILLVALMATLFNGNALAQVLEEFNPIADWARIRKIVANQSISPEWRDGQGYSAAYYQLLYGSSEYASKLIARSNRKGRWIEGQNDSLLEVAIRKHSPRVVAALIDHGEPIATLDKGRTAPLQLAVSTGQFEIVRLLLQAGADGYCRGCVGEPPIATALSQGNWRMALLMRDLGVDMLQYRKQPNQGDLVFRAIDGGQLDAVLMLLALKFDLNSENEAGMAPVAYALQKHTWGKELIDYLLDNADYCRRNRRGQRILEQVSTVEWLFEPINDDWIKNLTHRTAECDLQKPSNLQ
jgi:hypothetical protein